MNTRETGKIYEEQAAACLEEKGFLLIARNFQCRQGEIDLIGIHEECLVFVEVKYRKNSGAGQPEEAVDVRKQTKICAASDFYRMTHRKEAFRQVRYDVVAVCGDEITWHQNAFSYTGRNGRISW